MIIISGEGQKSKVIKQNQNIKSLIVELRLEFANRISYFCLASQIHASSHTPTLHVGVFFAYSTDFITFVHQERAINPTTSDIQCRGQMTSFSLQSEL